VNEIKNNTLFTDLTVLELSSVLAGPAVGMFFAELGAKVIKVENSKTGGDVTRSWKMSTEDPETETSAYYHSVNWNKEVHQLDLSDEQERSRVYEWVRETDVVITNFKHGSAGKLGMDYESLRAINPALIYGSISAYGKHDPRPGFDVSMQAETGWVYMNGDENGPPTKMPVALVDILAAHQLKEGILIALLNRMKSGGTKGCEVHVSLFDSSLASLANQASNWLNLSALPERQGSKHPNIAPYGDILNIKDGLQVMLTTGTQRQFEQLCKTLQLEAIITDSKFSTNAKRLENRSEMIEILQNQAEKYNYEELEAKNPDIRALMVPIQNLRQVFEYPEAQKLILKQTEADGSESKRVATVVFRMGE
jgi:crotonobetainyl-CoA:carnitine CoA-transferase CaiB-like acyl-CoA transferase